MFPSPAEQVWECSLSPRGDRLAWVTERAGENRFEGAMHDLWTSDIDGGNVTVVGSQRSEMEPAREGETRPRYYWPRGLRWLPDGERVSFVFRGVVWVVSVGR